MRTATQELSPTDKVRRWAICPEHERRSSDYAGEDEEGWLFRCKVYRRHIFHALPDKSAPRTAEEVAAWMERQRAARLQVKA